jgi:hypothetical protein
MVGSKRHGMTQVPYNIENIKSISGNASFFIIKSEYKLNNSLLKIMQWLQNNNKNYKNLALQKRLIDITIN